jgi:hypothetical protein
MLWRSLGLAAMGWDHKGRERLAPKIALYKHIIMEPFATDPTLILLKNIAKPCRRVGDKF